MDKCEKSLTTVGRSALRHLIATATTAEHCHPMPCALAGALS